MDRYISEKETLELLLKTYVEMVSLKSCEVGEKSHMLAHHTDFIRRQINEFLKIIKQRE